MSVKQLGYLLSVTMSAALAFSAFALASDRRKSTMTEANHPGWSCRLTVTAR